jgi:putative copper resistance protein D
LLAAGTPVFVRLFGRQLDRSAEAIRAMAISAAAVALVVTVVHVLVEPARLTGELRGMLDGSLQMLLLKSGFGAAAAVRVAGVALILVGSLQRNRTGDSIALLGALIAVVSFAFTGHTAANSQRWLLAVLLTIHISALAFWFGGLRPLLAVSKYEGADVAAAIVARFSNVAMRLVPLVLFAGIAMAAVLLEKLASLWSPYGLLLIAKISGFTLLMLLAAANRWRFGPGIATDTESPLRAFQRTIRIEWCLVFAIVLITAVMTALYSP